MPTRFRLDMPDRQGDRTMALAMGSRSGIIYFILGALVVAVGVLGWIYFDRQDESVKLEINIPDVTVE